MNNEERNEIIHRWQNKQSARSIARELNVSRYMVDRVIRTYVENRDAELATEADTPPASLGSAPSLRSSKLDAHNDKIKQLLERYPKITAQRIYEEIKLDGYNGGHSILRQRIRLVHPQNLWVNYLKFAIEFKIELPFRTSAIQFPRIKFDGISIAQHNWAEPSGGHRNAEARLELATSTPSENS